MKLTPKSTGFNEQIFVSQISLDNLLWKCLLRRDFRPNNLTLRPGAGSWRDEYVRLVDAVPKIKVQSLDFHSDEVLHVAFSHDGNEIVSCSKVWNVHRTNV